MQTQVDLSEIRRHIEKAHGVSHPQSGPGPGEVGSGAAGQFERAMAVSEEKSPEAPTIGEAILDGLTFVKNDHDKKLKALHDSIGEDMGPNQVFNVMKKRTKFVVKVKLVNQAMAPIIRNIDHLIKTQ